MEYIDRIYRVYIYIYIYIEREREYICIYILIGKHSLVTRRQLKTTAFHITMFVFMQDQGSF